LFNQGYATPLASIVPKFGCMVTCLNDDRNIHGFTEPVAAGDNGNDARFAGNGVIYWQQHGARCGVKALEHVGYKVLQRDARILSKHAHKLHPGLQHAARPNSGAEPQSLES
jgi:hypothetical protein